MSTSSVEKFVKENKEFFNIGYPIDFINIEGITKQCISKKLKDFCDEPKRIRTTSKEAKRMQEEYNKLDNPHNINTNIYTPENEKRLRIYKLNPEKYASESEYESEEEEQVEDEIECESKCEDHESDEKLELLHKFNEKLSKMTLDELRILYCKLF